MTKQRLDNLRAAIDEKGLDGLLISDADNRRYLSGFVGSAGYVFVARDGAVLLTDFRYTEQASEQAPDFRVDRISAKLDWLPGLCAEFGVEKLGFEADDVTVSQFARFKQAFNDKGAEVSLKSTTGLTLELRAVKDQHELGLLARAIEISDEAFDEVSEEISPGMTEAEVSARVEQAVKSRGAESISFETIVATGPNAARPHHRAGDTVIREGQTIVIDMGARYHGYCSDLTRTIVLGDADDKTKRVYDIVLSAQLAAIELVEAGMTGGETDMLARKVIQETGHGDDFGHSLGHGVGLQVHENPGVGPTSKGELKDGMVFTVEPGIYLPGWGGVRIEDIVVLEQGKARVMSRARKVSP